FAYVSHCARAAV
ncbi:carbohydrate diacid regulator, partial [Vibrio parahaemolyticus V-223/04]